MSLEQASNKCSPVDSALAPALAFFEDGLYPVSQINIFLPVLLLVRLLVIATGRQTVTFVFSCFCYCDIWRNTS